MRRLSTGGSADLLVGDFRTAVVVAEVSAQQVLLRVRGPKWPTGLPDVGGAGLVFDHRGLPTMIEGMAQRVDERSVRWFPARAALPSRRGMPRLRISLDATVQGRPTRTVDVSVSGVLLEAPGTLLPTRVSVTVDLAGVELRAEADVIRTTREHVACEWVALESSSRTRLEAIVRAVSTRLADAS